MHVKSIYIAVIVVLLISLTLMAVTPPDPDVEMPDHIKKAMKLIEEQHEMSGVERLLLDIKEEKRFNKSALTTTVNAVTPVLMGNYSDNAHIFTPTDFQNHLFGINPTGNMTEYYDWVSYGQFNLTGTVYGPYTAQFPQSLYVGTENGMNTDYPSNAAGFIVSILPDADLEIDFSQYDTDGPDGIPNSGDDDGYVDVLTIIFPDGSASQGDADNMWAHAWSITGAGGSEFVTTDAAAGGGFIKINRYTVNPAEKGNGTVNIVRTIGVYCHEYGHMLGYPDFYDGDYETNGIGGWCLMGYANAFAGGEYPGHLSAWCKIYSGWVTPTEISSPMTLDFTNFPPTETNPVVYKIWEDGFKGGRYFLLENRGPSYDLSNPEGLLIWHVNEDILSFHNRGSDNSLRFIDVVEADGFDDLDHRFNFGDDGDFFPGSSNVTSITDDTYPSVRDVNGKTTGIIINNIGFDGAGGTQFTCDVTPREIFGYTVNLHPGKISAFGYGSSNETVRHGAIQLNATADGELVSIKAGNRANEPNDYAFRIYEFISGSSMVNLQSTTNGIFEDLSKYTYVEIPLSSTYPVLTGQPIAIEGKWGPMTYAVPITDAQPISLNSYYSQTGSGTYTKLTDFDVLLQAQVLTNCVDPDLDDVCAYLDNCLDDSNPDQDDSDGDGNGDACDVCPFDANDDIDGDSYCADVDNCPELYNPDQTDLNGNLIGDACECLDEALSFTAEAAYDWLGWRSDNAGDVNGDGHDDIITGSRYNDEAAPNAGKAYVFSGRNGDTLFVLLGKAEYNQFGASVAGIGDINKDGFGDFVVGAFSNDDIALNAGAAYIFYGESSLAPVHKTADDANYIHKGSAEKDAYGWEVASAGGDIDGDTYPDYMVSSLQTGNDLTGIVYVYSGQTHTVLYTLTGENSDDGFGYDMEGGDFNNDGRPDIIVGAIYNDAVGVNNGRGYLFYTNSGPYPQSIAATSADHTFGGDPGFTWFGGSVSSAGNVNNDTHNDIVIGSPTQSRVIVYSGADFSVLHDIAGSGEERLGWSVTRIGDYNNDGYDDFAAGAHRYSIGATDIGRAYIYSGFDGSILKVFTGTVAGERLGRDIVGTGDFNDDGYNDLIACGFLNDEIGSEGGKVYIFHLGVDPDGDNILAGCDNCGAVSNPLQEDSDGNGIGDLCDSCCKGLSTGNIDNDEFGSIDVSDLVYLVNWIFKDGPDPACEAEADFVEVGGGPDVSDLVYMVNFIFKDGPPLPACM